MAKKSRRLDTRTVLIIILVLVIFGGGYIIVTNLPEEVDYKSVDDIMNNKQTFVNQKVTVKGIYNFDDNIPGIISTNIPAGGGIPNKLNLDLRILDINETDDLRVDVTYFFTGTIIDEGIPVTPDLDLILVVEKFERV